MSIPAKNNKVIDVHVHLAALPDGANGCRMSAKMRGSGLTKFILWRLGGSHASPSQINQIYIDRLVRAVRDSVFVCRVVLLALDGSYDPAGNLDSARTTFMISNDYLFETVKRYPDVFIPGCSVNPQRRDAVAEVNRCAKAGAVLVKVLPNAQGFDPANPAYIPYYQALAQNEMALLCHVGKEFSVTSGHQTFGDPSRLTLALDQGVKVIAAHGMSYGLPFWEPYFETMKEFARKYPNFYWDASALSLLNRFGMLLRLRNTPGLHARMLFGTDYPLPCFAFPALLAGHWSAYWRLRKIKNSFDRHYELLRILGFPEPQDL